MLVIAVLFIIFDSIKSIDNGNISILTLVSNALLLLVIKEVMWTVLRFLRQEQFSLSPFIYVGVISGIREILFLSIQKSVEKGNEINITLEMLINAFVVFLLVVAYYIFKKARILAGEDS